MKFCQRPDRLVHFKNSTISEWLNSETPDGEMAVYVYDDVVIDMFQTLNKLTPKQYFEEHIAPTPLFQTLWQSYKEKTKVEKIPRLSLSKEEERWYESGSLEEIFVYK